ncbi:NADH-quinone oxidoreductase subunit K [Nesterenkonia sandarakina]|uniref:Multicomponent Na+:H+ antiporter subunit C n=1 Tax=Nesterenkonia sandarakina TaxID=272918 RepID=A0A7Z0J2Y9_9MICC|nr:NADH-quinone oxidoreductase subunit K [Nesterenkonia sandarakina]NYJ16446.1 multicomponent Na+:H+ antiporter subunit C [Nesterenkonia sandarakina]
MRTDGLDLGLHAAGSPALGMLELSQVQWYLLLGTGIAVIGLVRMLLTSDLVARLIALNVTGIGSLMIIMALAARAAEPEGPVSDGAAAGIDPVLSALVITGLVITVAFTGLGAVLIRRIEGSRDGGDAPDGEVQR